MSVGIVDIIGSLAALMTVTAFACRAMLGLAPILALHCLLLPLNIIRLRNCWKDRLRGSWRLPGAVETVP